MTHDINMNEIGCFVKGTLIHTDKGIVPIQDIKVGDMVLSKPEDGSGEPEYKPVVKTFVHQNKEIWLVEAQKSFEMDDRNGNLIPIRLSRDAECHVSFLSTPNQPVWVEGRVSKHSNHDVEFYPKPHWKRVDELRQGEVIVNNNGTLYFIKRAQPTYQFDADKLETKPSYYWYQKNYHTSYEDYLNDDDMRPDFDVTEEEYMGEGYAENIEKYYEYGFTSACITDDTGFLPDANTCKDAQGEYIPFTDTVYNFEVSDNHTYFIDDVGLWVHNTNGVYLAIEASRGMTQNRPKNTTVTDGYRYVQQPIKHRAGYYYKYKKPQNYAQLDEWKRKIDFIADKITQLNQLDKKSNISEAEKRQLQAWEQELKSERDAFRVEYDVAFDYRRSKIESSDLPDKPYRLDEIAVAEKYFLEKLSTESAKNMAKSMDKQMTTSPTPSRGFVGALFSGFLVWRGVK